MTTAKHGPWSIETSEDGSLEIYSAEARVASKVAPDCARLLAAAPELLAALDLAAFALEGRREDDDPTLQQVRAAIAKAKGTP